MPILRGSLIGPPRFRPLTPVNEISTHLTVSCLETSAARCNSATRAWMSSRWMASGPQVRVASAARTRVDAGLFGSTLPFGRRRTRHLLQSGDRLPKIRSPGFPRSPLALWREGPDGGLGQSASKLPTRPACSAQELALEAGAFNNAVELVALLPSNGRSIQGNTCRAHFTRIP